MERNKILERLADPNIPFLEKLRYAANLEVDMWEDRDPPNLGEGEFKRLIHHIPLKTEIVWLERESKSGPHGLTGDDEVFKFQFSVKLMGFEITYFVKGYFFDKGACQGVCIQSFREVSRTKLSKFRIIR